MTFYKYKQYLNNYSLRYLINKSNMAEVKHLPKISSLTLAVRYNPYRYDQPSSYINDFIFIWYAYTNEQFTSYQQFQQFYSSARTRYKTKIKQLCLQQIFFNTNAVFNIFYLFNKLIKKNVLKEALASTHNTFLVQSKKTNFITYNATNNNTFFIPFNTLNFEQITYLYNFILNPIDFYTDFKINIIIKTNTINTYHVAWLLNLTKFNYFFTAEKYKYNKYTR